MESELDKLLCDSFPNLYKDRNGSPQETCMFWGFPKKGWFLIIWNLSKQIEKIILDFPEEERSGFRAAQVKEKFGTLTFYMTAYTSQIRTLINEAQALSHSVCEDCGQPGRLRNHNGWLYTACDTHTKQPIKLEINTIVLHFGEENNTYLAPLIAVNRSEKFTNPEKAIRSLARELLLKYKNKFAPQVSYNECCKLAMQDDSNNYCAKCGKDLKLKFEPTDFRDWLDNLVTFDLASWSSNGKLNSEEMLWEVGHSPLLLLKKNPDNIISINNNAAKNIMEALGFK